MDILIIIFLVILLLIITVLLIAVVKLFKINDAVREENEKLSDKISDIKLYVFEAYMNMRAVDTLGAFESDDEAGYIFNAIRKIIIDLGVYSVEEIRVLHENPELADPRAKKFVNDLYEKLKNKKVEHAPLEGENNAI